MLRNHEYPEVGPDLFDKAWARIEAVREVDPQAIQDGVALAGALQGLSAAVSDIALANGGRAERRSRDPQSGVEHVVSASPGRDSSSGASVRVTDNYPRLVYGGRDEYASFGVDLPTDAQVDTLLTDEPVLWNMWGVSAHRRDRQSISDSTFHPFGNRAGNLPLAPQGMSLQGASHEYFVILQLSLDELATLK